MTIIEALQLAVQRQQAGQLDEAAALYSKILAAQPNHVDALNLLGTVHYQRGNFDAASELIRKALASKPAEPIFLVNLALVLRSQGKLDESLSIYRRALDAAPNNPDVLAHFASACLAARLWPDAISAFTKIVEILPDSADAHCSLGNAFQAAAKLDDAIAEYQTALKLNPNLVDAECNLGNCFLGRQELSKAIPILQRAVARNPNSVDANFILGNALRAVGRWTEAVQCYQKVLSQKPDDVPTLINLAAVIRRMGQSDKAIELLNRVIEIDPTRFEAHLNLGGNYMDCGRVPDAIDVWEKACALNPNEPRCDNNRVYALYFDPRQDSQSILAQLKKWNATHAAPLTATAPPVRAIRKTNHRLRIGYLSSNFNLHVVGRNVLPILMHHDRQRFEIHCYSTTLDRDSTTEKMRSLTDGWHDVLGVSDEDVAAMIRADEIDILVDLTLHMISSRLLVMARRPAPVQVTFAGYPGGTGVSAIDWRLTDPYLDPPGRHDSDYVEKSWRLPHSFWCYDPRFMADDAPEVGPLPALQNGFVTFCCLNNFCKVNEPTLFRWSRVLNALPNSRLLLLTPAGDSRHRVRQTLAAQGIAPGRIDFVASQDHSLYMNEFNRADLGLDTLPYNGHSTSLDSLWMGVPVVTQIGRTIAGRAGFSQLSNLNLTDLAATDDDHFVQIAVELAGDLPRLAELRRTMRDRMLNSPLTDAVGFTRGIEAAYDHFVADSVQQPSQ